MPGRSDHPDSYRSDDQEKTLGQNQNQSRPISTDSEQMLHLEALNEKGTIRWRDPQEGLVEFRYTNQFCGSCSFLSRVVETLDRGVILSEKELTWEDFSLKRGSSKALSRNACVFFDQYLRRQSSVKVLHRQISVSSGQSLWDLLRRWFGMDSSPRSNGHISFENISESSSEDHICTTISEKLLDQENVINQRTDFRGDSKREFPILELELSRRPNRDSLLLDLPLKNGRSKNGHYLSEDSDPDDTDQKGRNGRNGRTKDSRTLSLPFSD